MAIHERKGNCSAESSRIHYIGDGQDVPLETDEEGTTQVTYTQTRDVYGQLVSQRREETTNLL